MHIDTVDQVDYDILTNKLIDAKYSIEELSKCCEALRRENDQLKKDLKSSRYSSRYSDDTIWKVRYDKLREALR